MLRFETAQALFEFYPAASMLVKAEPTEEPSLDFLRKLLSNGKFEDAAAFCAYILPRREAVWFACRTVRAFMDEPIIAAFDKKPLELAEAWVAQPDESRRVAAQSAATQGNQDSPTTWVGHAAAWSGGVFSIGNMMPAAPPPHITANAATVAILLCSRRVPMPRSGVILKGCIFSGVELAQTGL